MASRGNQSESKVVAALVIGGVCYAALDHTGPLMQYGAVNPWAASAVAGLALSATILSAGVLRLMAAWNNTRLAKKPLGLKGTSGFATLHDLRHELEPGWGPWWGAAEGKELIVDYVSNALTISPAGTFKDVGIVQPTALSIRESKTVADKKGTSACVLAEALEARGEIVHVLNLGDVWGDTLGESATYNPLCWFADNFWTGSILDVADDAHEIAMQLLPEPAGREGGDGNKYFRDGSRDLISFAIQACVLVKGYGANPWRCCANAQ